MGGIDCMWTVSSERPNREMRSSLLRLRSEYSFIPLSSNAEGLVTKHDLKGPPTHHSSFFQVKLYRDTVALSIFSGERVEMVGQSVKNFF